jgi:hypothetical protein
MGSGAVTLKDVFEPAAVAAGEATPELSTNEVATISAAISLKRIADAIDGQSPDGSVLYWLASIAHSANPGVGR